jgi:hypothetical protein
MSTIDDVQPPQNDKPLRRYSFSASRDVHGTQDAEISVIASTEEKARDEAQAQIDECEVDWSDPDITDKFDADLAWDSCEDLTDEEIETYWRQQQLEEEAATVAEQRVARRVELHTILESLRATASEEERSRLFDDLEQMIV